MMITTNSVARLAQRCGEFLGDFGQTMTPSYPASLALCILDAIYSTGSHPTAVDKVVARYIAQHGEAHGAKSLRYSIAAAGGARPWAEFEACNLKPASTRPGAVLKAEVVDDATRVMADYGIDDVGDLLEAVGEGVGNDAFYNDVSKAWRALPSQSSGITWLHLLMLAGCPQFEVDDKVVGYLAEVAASEADLTVDYVHDEIHAVARVLDTEVSAVRRIVWQASHGRILSLLKDEDLLPADGPIEGPETSSSVWEFSPEPVAGRPF